MDDPRRLEHDWIHLLYMAISVIFFVIEVSQRVSIDLSSKANRERESAR